MTDAIRDQNHVTVALGVSNSDATVTLPFKIDSATGRLLTDAASGSGTVTSVSVVTANGFAGTVANATTTPAITLTTTVTGILKGNGTAISAASAGTDYVAPGSITTSGLTMNTARMLGRATAGSGAIEEIAVTGSGSAVLATAPVFPTSITVGVAAGTTGSVIFKGTTSGTVTLKVADAAGTWTMTLPTTDGNSGEFLQTDGNGVLTWAAPSASAGGSNTQVQYNNGGNLGGVTGATSDGTKITFTAGNIVIANLLASSNDSGALGASGTAFADLFLADGGVINWNAGNATITHSTGLLTTNVPVTITGVATASGFAPTANTTTGNRMYLPAANTIGFAINGTGEVQIDATATSPITNDGNALGTASLSWADLFLASGALINFANGNAVITHSSGIISVTTGEFRITSANVGTNADSVPTLSSTSTLTNKTLTAPTIGGAAQLSENGSIRLDQTLSADGTYTGVTIAGTAGATLAFGDLVYLAVADSRWELADADAASTAGDVLLGFCVLAAAADGDPTVILLSGNIRADTAFPALTVGAPVYVSTTAGDIQVAQPSGTDDVIRVVGFALTADSIVVSISPDYITHT